MWTALKKAASTVKKSFRIAKNYKKTKKIERQWHSLNATHRVDFMMQYMEDRDRNEDETEDIEDDDRDWMAVDHIDPQSRLLGSPNAEVTRMNISSDVSIESVVPASRVQPSYDSSSPTAPTTSWFSGIRAPASEDSPGSPSLFSMKRATSSAFKAFSETASFATDIALQAAGVREEDTYSDSDDDFVDEYGKPFTGVSSTLSARKKKESIKDRPLHSVGVQKRKGTKFTRR